MSRKSNPLGRNDDALAVALARYCGAQVALISAALQRRSHIHRGVHEARKGIRRLRSVIALGPAQLGHSAVGVDGALRRLGRGLSTVRDAQVVRDCARKRAKTAASAEQRALWLRITGQLASARSRAMRKVRARDKGFADRQLAIERIGKKISQLRWADINLATIHAQLRSSAKRAGRAADRYLAEPRLLSLHKLRRRLRRYRMQIAAISATLEPPTPAAVRDEVQAIIARHLNMFERLARRVDQLGELLDLHLLRTAIRRLPSSPDRSLALRLLRPS